MDVGRFAAAGGPFTLGYLTKNVFGDKPEPMRYAIHIVGDSVSLNDIAWVYPTLPRTGGGRLELDINNVRHPHIMDYAITRMDVRSTRSHLLGDMTYAVGGPVLVVKDWMALSTELESRLGVWLQKNTPTPRSLYRPAG